MLTQYRNKSGSEQFDPVSKARFQTYLYGQHIMVTHYSTFMGQALLKCGTFWSNFPPHVKLRTHLYILFNCIAGNHG